jgi:hypothetical protein
VAYRPLPRFSQTSQPQYAAQIDWSNPLTRGLAFAFYGDIREAVTGRLPTTNVGSVIPVEVGRAYSATSTTHLRTYALGTIAGTTPLTVMMAPRCNASNTTRKRAIRLITTDNGSGMWFEHSNGTSNFYYSGYQTTGGGFPQVRSGIATGTARSNVAISHSGAASVQARMWVDGVEYSTVADGTTGTRKALNQITLGNNTSGSGFQFNGDIPWVYLFLREISPEEQAEIFRNPWQIFRAPSRRLWVVPSGGATTEYGAASLSGVGTLAAAGVRTAFASVTLGGAGTLSATGTRTAFAAAGLLAEGSLTAVGVRTAFGAAALGGVGTLAADGSVGTVTRYGEAALAGVGSLSAAGVRTAFAAAALAGVGTLTATGTSGAVTRYGSVTLAAVGTLTGAGLRTAFGAATLAGVGTLSITIGVAVRKRASLLMAGSGDSQKVRFVGRSLKGEAGTKIRLSYGDKPGLTSE